VIYQQLVPIWTSVTEKLSTEYAQIAAFQREFPALEQ